MKDQYYGRVNVFYTFLQRIIFLNDGLSNILTNIRYKSFIRIYQKKAYNITKIMYREEADYHVDYCNYLLNFLILNDRTFLESSTEDL